MAFSLHSPTFDYGKPIPSKFTCEGEDISPPLRWTEIPEETKSLMLIVDDPDAPDPEAPETVWVHWVLYNLPPQVGSLPEGVTGNALPSGTLEGVNDWDRTGYGGPCPPIGTHRYFHKLYALDTVLPDLHEPTKEELLRAAEGHVILVAKWMGTYVKTED